jgi:LmbE family N-acetylglucosaminyl deacetylase
MLEGLFRGRALVVAPHYDDEAIGCGGALLRFRAAIDRLAVVHLTRADEARRREYAAVHAALRVDCHYALDGEDGFCRPDWREGLLELVRIIQTERPQVLLAPHAKEAHPDHQAAAALALDAAQKARFWDCPAPATPHRAPLLLGYEVWTALARPALVCDVSAVFEEKCALVARYETQTNAFPYVPYVRALNGWRGLLFHRSGHAEAFDARAV